MQPRRNEDLECSKEEAFILTLAILNLSILGNKLAMNLFVILLSKL
jgi:hypothetical protein